MNFNERYAKEDKKKEASAAEVLGLLTPAAILAQPFITDKINERNDKKRKQEKPEEEDALEKEDQVQERRKASFDERYVNDDSDWRNDYFNLDSDW